ncbi:hypothetical protein Pflav_089870 [Phytohabitans flavus]|uniref:Uncharacterized protein n=2 Tax=Phytohabitans flavus TaxID=1076124 RepID=A0A6F8Y931_9ACTN|nr:FxsC protein [Phytohabitans flavus]BCB82577.1 hypothetical protein Pflav_089870 [Phytohabitans flavus]
MRLQRNQDSYYDLIVELARQIVQTADAHQVPHAAMDVDFEGIPSAFHSAETSPVKVPSQPGQSRHVQFVVAAPARGELTYDDLATVERDIRYYGATSVEWAPYRPTLAVPIADFARTVAERRSFRSDVADTAGLAQKIGEARRSNQIIVLLVDVWSTMLREYRQALAECNQLDENVEEPVTAIMVPLNHDDQQAQVHRRQLTDSLRAIFFRRTVHGDDVMFRSSILTHQAFDADLQVVLEAARNRVFSSGTVHNRPTGQTVNRPILQGP